MLEPAYRLFIRDEDDWCAQGRYESIINRTPTAEDYIKWMKDENDKYFIHILGVCVSILIFKISKKILDNFRSEFFCLSPRVRWP
jgi:hypothetical protein